MIWEGKELVTIGDLDDVVWRIANRDDQEAADRFMELYFAENVHAYQNVGYLAGYHSPELAQKIFRLFRTAHPVFGTRTNLDPDYLFDAGKRLAEARMGESNEYE